MIYDITGRQRLNCNDIASILETILGEPITYVTITVQTAKTALIKAGFQLEWVDYILDFYRIIREGRMRRISKTVEAILGRKPISFETFVQDHIQLFKNRIDPKVNSQ
ncbi:hypothetical protein [Candidatus Nitrosocosmicus hydrocola]|uniref:hypothetical protein n=1 Tax=Candidatus Nitrosocosmicus hydrocola TaxID=1826872 RepID=UPI0011E5A939|nr:hypothetical protein [Candidatus Nitrosocosmicus hydrocola]